VPLASALDRLSQKKKNEMYSFSRISWMRPFFVQKEGKKQKREKENSVVVMAGAKTMGGL
jgi:hypothetical protein